jgi:hypothetical protein
MQQYRSLISGRVADHRRVFASSSMSSPDTESAITLCYDNVTATVRLHIKDLARLVGIKVEATTIDRKWT